MCKIHVNDNEDNATMREVTDTLVVEGDAQWE